MGCKLIKLKVAAGLWWGILQKWEWNAVAVDGAYFEAVGLVIRTQNFHSLPDRILGFTVKTNRDPATRHPESQGCYPDNVLSGWHLTPPLKHSSPSACPQLLQRERDGSQSAEAWAIASFPVLSCSLSAQLWAQELFEFTYTKPVLPGENSPGWLVKNSTLRYLVDLEPRFPLVPQPWVLGSYSPLQATSTFMSGSLRDHVKLCNTGFD